MDSQYTFGQSTMIIYILCDLKSQQSDCNMLFHVLEINLQASESIYCCDLSSSIEETFFYIIKVSPELYHKAHLQCLTPLTHFNFHQHFQVYLLSFSFFSSSKALIF